MKDKTVVVFEFGSQVNHKIWEMSDGDISKMGIQYLEKMFNLNTKELSGYRVERLPAVYPVLLKEYEQRQRDLNLNIGLKNLFLIGRTGLFKYHMLEEAYDSGIEAAKHIESLV